MVGELFAIASAYGLGICLLHMMHSRLVRREATHIVLMTNHVGSSIEWHLRSIALMSWLRSRETTVTVLDEGSTDDTVRIAMRLAGSSRLRWNVVAASSTEEAEAWLSENISCVDQVTRLRGLSSSGEAVGAAPVS